MYEKALLFSVCAFFSSNVILILDLPFFSPIRDYDREQFAENPVPLLLIGTKFDQIPETKRSEVLTRTAFLSEDFNAEEINLVCQLSLDKMKNNHNQNLTNPFELLYIHIIYSFPNKQTNISFKISQCVSCHINMFLKQHYMFFLNLIFSLNKDVSNRTLGIYRIM